MFNSVTAFFMKLMAFAGVALLPGQYHPFYAYNP